MTADEITVRARERADHDGVAQWVGLMRVLLDELARTRLPVEVLPAYTFAQGYWRGETSNISPLDEQRAHVWSYLDQFPGQTDVQDRNGRVARALLCVLSPDGDDERFSMTAEWFAAMTDRTVPEQPQGG